MKALCIMLLMGPLFIVGQPLPAQVNLPRAETPPSIDGSLDDGAWKRAAEFGSFMTVKPVVGLPASEKTQVLVTYDSDFLYVAFRCFDHDPGTIRATLSKRDAFAENDDYAGIMLDTRNDCQFGYVFSVTPLGSQRDSIYYSSDTLDHSFDALWRSAGRRHGEGYDLEIAIPFQSLRFPGRPSVIMGLKAFRRIGRTLEESGFPEVNPGRGQQLTQLQAIRMDGLHPPRLREAMPVLTFSRRELDGPEKEAAGRGKLEPSLNLKIGLHSDLVLDATVNPDFSHVESDAGQVDVNLRNSLSYAEKRPFFLEGMESFDFSSFSEQNPLASVVYTRSIVDPRWGIKLSGKVSPRDSLLLLAAQDQYAGDVDGEGEDGRALVSVLRYRRHLGGSSNSYLGGFLTSREEEGRFSRLVGFDGRVNLGGSRNLEYYSFASYNRLEGGSREGLAAAVHYSMGNRFYFLRAGVAGVSRDFTTAVGYLRRPGIITVPVAFAYYIHPRSHFFRRIDLNVSSTVNRDLFDRMTETANHFCFNLALPRTYLHVHGNLKNEVFRSGLFNRNGYGFDLQSQVTPWLFAYASLVRQRLIRYDAAAPYPGRGTTGLAGFTLLPLRGLSCEGSLHYSEFLRLDGRREYDYLIVRSSNTWQIHPRLFVRGVLEYNSYWKRLNADALLSFTYSPGTVLQAGYGAQYGRSENGLPGESDPRLDREKRCFFFKMSYLWRF